jgi:hypothetical protein
MGTLSINPPADLLLQARFDGHIVQEVGRGFPLVEGAFAFEAGYHGQSLRLPHESGLAYPVQGNLQPEAGTISLWARVPERYPVNRIDRHYLFAASANPQDLAHGVYTGTLALRRDRQGPDGAPRWNFWTVPLTGEAESDNLTAPDSLDPGWHHLAVTWDAAQRSKALYIDGKLIASTADAALPADVGSLLHLGRFTHDGNQSGMLLDDLAIFGRALTDDEIASLADADLPVAASASHIYSRTLLLDTNAIDSGGRIEAVELGLNGVLVEPAPYYDEYRWRLPAQEGVHTLEVRYTDQAGNYTHLTRTVRLNLPPRGTVAITSFSELTATLAISVTDVQQPIAMQLSHSREVAADAWQPVQSGIEWQWLHDDDRQYPTPLYVRFRDASGQVSDPVRVAFPYQQQSFLPMIQAGQSSPQSRISSPKAGTPSSQ